MTFEPIAIIGQACLFPGALNPDALWQNILANKNSLLPAKRERWRVDPKLLGTKNNHAGDYIVTDKCGYVEGFEEIFNPEGFRVPAEIVLEQDQLCQWLLHTGREALKNAGINIQMLEKIRAGTIFGNLSYPTAELNRYVEAIWLASQDFPEEILAKFKTSPDLSIPQQRFMSGYPALFMANAFGLSATCYALDAACASSLYAIERACRELQYRKADLMLAGGINLTDGLFLNLGFSALQALSPTGQSRPLHNKADGLIPSQGAGVFVLKRLADAIEDKNTILGVIRGVGLSNDGRSRGFLVPDQNGQVRAMQKAYEQSGVSPENISWIECHATGTVLGDAIEINSMQKVFSSAKNISIGALKGNIGHSITASGAAALIKVLCAFNADCKPPTLYAPEEPTEALQNTPFRLSGESEDWKTKDDCIAAVNCFGFGGNNAHLLVEKWRPITPVHEDSSTASTTKAAVAVGLSKGVDIAIVGIGIIAANTKNKTEFMHAWENKISALSEYRPGLLGGFLESVELSFEEAHFPPADLKRAVGQQLAVLKAAQAALSEVPDINASTIGAWVGMGCDTEVARSGFGCRLTEIFPQAKDDWLAKARESIRPTLEAADAIGAMPNIVTNRLNAEFDFQAPSYSVSAEEASGLIALELGIQHLKEGSVDVAVVGGVDICCELGHRSAAVNILPVTRQIPGDAAVVLILKRMSDAKKAGNKIYATLSDAHPVESHDAILSLDGSSITRQFGHAHAASGLLHVAAGALLLDEKKYTSVRVDVKTFTDKNFEVILGNRHCDS